MAVYTFSSIANILHTAAAQQVADPVVEYILTDSRKLLHPETTLFFAIGSKQKDASLFVIELYEKGVTCFIVPANISRQVISKCAQANFILADDVLGALQHIAAWHRAQFAIPVIGITGSNGKTIVKEWLNQLLQDQFSIVRSPKSYNSQLGVPVSVWQMDDMHSLAIFEAGISQPGEMELLQKIIQPTLGVFTMAGDAHAAGFADIPQKIAEKLLLFTTSKNLICCADDLRVHAAVQHFKKTLNPALQTFSWSHTDVSDVKIINIQRLSDTSIITYRYKQAENSFTIYFTDEASLQNAVTCLCVLLFLKISNEYIEENMRALKPVGMRLQLIEGINNCSIINDSYNSDYQSFLIALDFLSQQQQHPNKTVILSDMLQTGKDAVQLYSRVASSLLQKNIVRFIGIGPELSANQHLFTSLPVSIFFSTTAAFLQAANTMVFRDESILLKGARVFQFEKINHLLEEKTHETILEINLGALRHNLNYYRSRLSSGVKIMAMVKAFSYGSGSFEIANVMQHAGIDYLAVAYADEGVELRQSGIRLPIMVMNTEEASFENLVKFDLEPELYSFKILNAFADFLKLNDKGRHPVHIKLETGMHRLGFEATDILELCRMLVEHRDLQVRSVFSHLAGSGDATHDDFTKQQAAQLNKMSMVVENALGYKVLTHIANTSAIHRHPQLQLDMVRLGIGLYGIDAVEAVNRHLLTVTSFTTTISQIKHLQPGDSVGYNRKGEVQQPTTIATVRVGYADGYPRALSNGVGKMLVNGKPASVIGNVCMDMTMLNITGLDA
ncbi:MAG: bifunctional UDP-N-acetylmuramoyl-tripeptide:D-alanyl-D-alanine ligase/alanine racemase, partial [Ferruginibacter sp.]